ETIITADVKYTLMISGGANVALGGVVARSNIFTQTNSNLIVPPLGVNDNGCVVNNGDLGALAAGDTNGAGATDGLIISASLPYEVNHGNLRAINAISIGYATGNGSGVGVDLLVPRGLVGLIRTTGTTNTGAFAATMDVNSRL